MPVTIPQNSDMRFEVTTRCNYNCVICPREKLTRKKETMSLELFKKLLDKILDETDRYSTVSFPGMGEPLMDGSLDEKITYAKKKNLSVLILTNGSFLSVDRFKELEDLGVESIRVSFYGARPQSYAKAHGVKEGGLFEKVRENLNKIAKIKRHTRLLLTFNAVRGVNDGCDKDWIDEWKDKADLLEVWRPHNWVDGRGYRKVQEKKLATCGRPFRGPLQIQVDGTVNMCCFDFDGKLTLGDLKTESLEDIFSSKIYKEIAACHTSGDFEGSGLICQNCDQRNSDKSDVMTYNSISNDRDKRVKQLSTTYEKVL